MRVSGGGVGEERMAAGRAGRTSGHGWGGEGWVREAGPGGAAELPASRHAGSSGRCCGRWSADTGIRAAQRKVSRKIIQLLGSDPTRAARHATR
jgi:hypothetical protein